MARFAPRFLALALAAAAVGSLATPGTASAQGYYWGGGLNSYSHSMPRYYAPSVPTNPGWSSYRNHSWGGSLHANTGTRSQDRYLGDYRSSSWHERNNPRSSSSSSRGSR